MALFISCDGDKNDDELSPFAQENIKWSSLADTPWPIYNHDVQNTNRSANNGKAVYFDSGTLDYNGNYYSVGLTTEDEHELLSISYDGTLNWIVPLLHYQGTSLLSDINNNVYISGHSGFYLWHFSSFSQEGELNWSVEIPYQFYETPVMLSDGRIALPAIRARPTNLVIVE